MIDDLIQFHKNKLTFSSWIYPAWGRAIIMTCLMILPVFVFWFFITDFNDIRLGDKSLFSSLSFYFCVSTFTLIAILAETFARIKINASIFSISNRNELFKAFVKLQFSIYMTQESELRYVPTEKVLMLLETRAKREKLFFTSYRIAFGVLAGAVWVSFVNAIFSLEAFNSLEGILIVFAILILATSFIAWTYLFFKFFTEDLLTNYKTVKDLISNLEEFELMKMIGESKYSNEEGSN